jgi:BirA family transcriptional regulator, biotin operon repressor / biotin---[acetyl-CoA-carboxylase] ligase
MDAHNSAINPKTPTRGSLSAEAGTITDARLGRIVNLLTEHAMMVVSGTKIADELGTNRSEVWRLVQQLRELGVEIAGHPATGYRLEAMPDLLLPEILEPLVKGTMSSGKLHHFFRSGSTNEIGMQAAAEGASEGTTFLAEEQTAGRGRGDHSWESSRSEGIYFSIVLRPPMSPADVLVISLVAGLAVVDAVRSVTGLEPDLRWPNDVMLNGRKFCGILTELNAELTRVRYAVVGIGINVNQPNFAGELSQIATSLRIETGREWSRVELAAALLKSLDRKYRLLLSQSGREAVFAHFEQASSYAKGKRVRVDEDGGYEGVTAGLDARGFLQVRTSEGTRTVLSGSVRAI